MMYQHLLSRTIINSAPIAMIHTWFWSKKINLDMAIYFTPIGQMVLEFWMILLESHFWKVFTTATNCNQSCYRLKLHQLSSKKLNQATHVQWYVTSTSLSWGIAPRMSRICFQVLKLKNRLNVIWNFSSLLAIFKKNSQAK